MPQLSAALSVPGNHRADRASGTQGRHRTDRTSRTRRRHRTDWTSVTQGRHRTDRTGRRSAVFRSHGRLFYASPARFFRSSSDFRPECSHIWNCYCSYSRLRSFQHPGYRSLLYGVPRCSLACQRRCFPPVAPALPSGTGFRDPGNFHTPYISYLHRRCQRIFFSGCRSIRCPGLTGGHGCRREFSVFRYIPDDLPDQSGAGKHDLKFLHLWPEYRISKRTVES